MSEISKPTGILGLIRPFDVHLARGEYWQKIPDVRSRVVDVLERSISDIIKFESEEPQSQEIIFAKRIWDIVFSYSHASRFSEVIEQILQQEELTSEQSGYTMENTPDERVRTFIGLGNLYEIYTEVMARFEKIWWQTDVQITSPTWGQADITIKLIAPTPQNT